MAIQETMNASAFRFFVESGRANANQLRAINVLGQLLVTPRVQDSPHLPPSASGGSVSASFANDQVLTDPAGFELAEGTVSLVMDGAFVRSGRLSGTDYKVGTRYYWEEGVARLVTPFQGVFLGNHNADFPAGALRIVDIAGTKRFQWEQADAAGTAVLTYTFTDPAVPVGSSAAGSVPEYFYYSFEKRAGEITLTVASTFGVQTQTIPSIPEPTPTAGASDGVHSLGKLSEPGGFQLLWFRSTYSDTADVPTVDATPWATPEIYKDPVTVVSYGNAAQTYLDSGQTGAYWNLPAFRELFHLPANSGGSSRLRARFVARDAIPVGQLHMLFSGEPYYEVPAGFFLPTALPLGGPQGRYLLIELEFVVSPLVALNGSASQFFDAAGAFAFAAQWQPDPWPFTPTPEVPAEIELLPEPEPDGVLPILPSIGARLQDTPPVDRISFEAPYSQTYPVGTVNPQSWSVAWSGITTEERDELLQFFEQGAERVFTWTNPHGVPGSRGSLLVDSLTQKWLGPGVWQMEGIIVERFA